MLALLFTLAVKLHPLLHVPAQVLAWGAADCDLRENPCAARFPDGTELSLSIQPAGIPLVKPLRLAVRLAAPVQPERVEVHFSGTDMDMGVNRVVLQPADSPGVYQGTGMLPMCVRESMPWEARVLLVDSEQVRAAAFRFATGAGAGTGARSRP